MNNTEKIVTIVKYVTITFNFPSGDYETMRLIPGSNFSDYLPIKELYLEDHSDHKYFYHAIYEWVNNNVPKFSQLAESSKIADVSPTEWESGENEWRNKVYIFFGLLGV